MKIIHAKDIIFYTYAYRFVEFQFSNKIIYFYLRKNLRNSWTNKTKVQLPFLAATKVISILTLN